VAIAQIHHVRESSVLGLCGNNEWKNRAFRDMRIQGITISAVSRFRYPGMEDDHSRLEPLMILRMIGITLDYHIFIYIKGYVTCGPAGS
jgi:hypothetical protein